LRHGLRHDLRHDLGHDLGHDLRHGLGRIFYGHQRREAIQRAHDFADGVGGDAGIECRGVDRLTSSRAGLRKQRISSTYNETNRSPRFCLCSFVSREMSARDQLQGDLGKVAGPRLLRSPSVRPLRIFGKAVERRFLSIATNEWLRLLGCCGHGLPHYPPVEPSASPPVASIATAPCGKWKNCRPRRAARQWPRPLRRPATHSLTTAEVALAAGCAVGAAQAA
jgi:hypothetical protein